MDQRVPETAADRFQDSRRSFIAALGRRDPAAAAAVYAADGRLLLPASTPLDGRAAIEAFWRAGLDAGMAAIELVPLSINLEASFACEVGAYKIRVAPRNEAPAVDRGRYLIVHRRESDGAWRRALELFHPEPDRTVLMET